LDDPIDVRDNEVQHLNGDTLNVASAGDGPTLE
jgi:hypothetical protein